MERAGHQSSRATTGAVEESRPRQKEAVSCPTITSLSPTSGPTSGGASAGVTGTGFAGPLIVWLGAAATTFTVDSDTQITAISPAGTAQITATSSEGISNRGCIAISALNSIRPCPGFAVGGTRAHPPPGLGLAIAPAIGSAAATSFIVGRETQLIAVAAGEAKTVQLTVATVGVSVTEDPTPKSEWYWVRAVSGTVDGSSGLRS